MRTGRHNAGWGWRAAWLAAAALAFVPTSYASWGGRGQHPGGGARVAVPAPHYSAPRAQAPRNQPNNQLGRPQNQGPGAAPQSQAPQYRPQGNALQRPDSNYLAPRPAYPGASNRPPGYAGTPYAGPARPSLGPPGHLGPWLNEHRGIQDQEQRLRNDPSFTQLPAGDQQRLLQQLHRVNQMPEEQRERRLARAEALEHMSPQDRMRLNMSGQRLAALPPDRQALVKNAFRDLRGVPLDQRQIVLNSSRYQGVFSPEERGILSDILRAEPYQPAH